MNGKNFISGVLLFCCCCGTLVYGQEAPALKVGLALSANTLTGDLLEQGNQRFRVYPGLHATLGFDRERHLRLQLNLGFAKVVEEWESGLQALGAPQEVMPTTYVLTPIAYGTLHLMYYPWLNRTWAPFASAGIGILRYTPQDQAGNNLADASFTRLAGETYSPITFQVPFRVGMELRFHARAGAFAACQYRLLFTDYLDNLGALGPRQGNDGLIQVQLGMFFLLEGKS